MDDSPLKPAVIEQLRQEAAAAEEWLRKSGGRIHVEPLPFLVEIVPREDWDMGVLLFPAYPAVGEPEWRGTVYLLATIGNTAIVSSTDDISFYPVAIAESLALRLSHSLDVVKQIYLEKRRVAEEELDFARKQLAAIDVEIDSVDKEMAQQEP